MKEKIFEILHNRKRMPGEHFSDIEGRGEELKDKVEYYYKAPWEVEK